MGRRVGGRSSLTVGDRVVCNEPPCGRQPMTGTIVGVLGPNVQYPGAGRRIEVEFDQEPLPGLGRRFALGSADLDRLEAEDVGGR